MRMDPCEYCGEHVNIASDHKPGCIRRPASLVSRETSPKSDAANKAAADALIDMVLGHVAKPSGGVIGTAMNDADAGEMVLLHMGEGPIPLFTKDMANAKPGQIVVWDNDDVDPTMGHAEVVACTCTNHCPEDHSENDCAYCRRLDIYDPCPVVGFGCGADCDDEEHCTLEQRKAADS